MRDERDVDLGGGTKEREERTRSLTPPKQLKEEEGQTSLAQILPPRGGSKDRQSYHLSSTGTSFP